MASPWTNRGFIVKRFVATDAFYDALARKLVEEFQRTDSGAFAVMLSGGETPLGAYRKVAESGARASHAAHVVFSDERMAPIDSPDSNFANARGMIEALGIPEERVIRVRTELSIGDAAERYHADIDGFFRPGGVIRFGLLGIGTDGHTASLFSLNDVIRGDEKWAMPVLHTPYDRVTVTARLIRGVSRIVFAASGRAKTEVLERLMHEPQSIPAGAATAGNPDVELWCA